MIFPIPELLAHLSTLMTLVPGDIVSTGTPAGVGGAREPRVWLQDGDEVVVSSPSWGAADLDRAGAASPGGTGRPAPRGCRAHPPPPRRIPAGGDRVLNVDQDVGGPPEDEEVEPVGRPDLGGDQDGGAEGGDLERGPPRGTKNRALPRTTGRARAASCSQPSDGSSPQTLKGEPREAW